LELKVPFQHKYGYIGDERSKAESYPYPSEGRPAIYWPQPWPRFCSAATQNGKGNERLI